MRQAALREELILALRTLYMGIELAKRSWQIAFGDGGNRRTVTIVGGDLSALLREVRKAKEKFGLAPDCRVVSCYETGRDGFWVHRWLVAQGIESVVFDARVLKQSGGGKKAKTDRLDAGRLLEALIRRELGFEKEGAKAVHVPSAQAEDERRLHRELERLNKEWSQHRNRIGSLLATQGVELQVSIGTGFLEQLDEVKLWDGSPLGPQLKRELRHEYSRLELVEEQILELEREKRARLKSSPERTAQQVRKLSRLCGIGEVGAWVLVMECFGWRSFRNGRQVGQSVGLAGTRRASGDSLDREQGISKAGNRRLRALMIELAWCWIRWQPESRLTVWFNERFRYHAKRARKVGIVAVARRLLIALWRYLERDIVPEGARLKARPRGQLKAA